MKGLKPHGDRIFRKGSGPQIRTFSCDSKKMRWLAGDALDMDKMPVMSCSQPRG